MGYKAMKWLYWIFWTVLFLPYIGWAEELGTQSLAPAIKPQVPVKASLKPTSQIKGDSPKKQSPLSLPNQKQATTYHLSIDYGEVNFTDSIQEAMRINGQLPAPTLYFEEGKKAIIYVTNEMDVESSIHWHGILLPNFQDGVSYLTTPPIKPGTTHKFEFTLKQSGTYWYHSHTGLQEQKGLYGAIVVQAKKKQYQYDHDLVLVLSDWTNEDPHEVLRTLKRGSEWYALKKGSALSLAEVIKNKVFKAQLALWGQRMPGMDISDVYYDHFLINGQREQKYLGFKAGEKIRLRIINAGASTYFWMSFGGDPPLLISADGLNVKPLKVSKILQAVAETYDFLITVPKNKSLEIKATAQDGTGFATALIGKGDVLKAPVIPKPDPIQEMRKMALMHAGHSMGHSAHKGHEAHHGTHEAHSGHEAHGTHKAHSGHEAHHGIHEAHSGHEAHGTHKAHSGHEAHHGTHKAHSGHEAHHGTHAKKQSTIESKREPNALDPTGHPTKPSIQPAQQKPVAETIKTKVAKPQDKAQLKQESANQTISHSHKGHKTPQQKTGHAHNEHKEPPQTFNYNQLESLEKTTFSNPHLKEIHLNLTGNMLRYVWSFNGQTLSQSDRIPIKKGETLRLHLHNNTMMHHPMHLHGHFFRVLNQKGEKAPLKHTVDVPPMQTVIIEFNPEEKGDWFFHCHILYHMKSGMSRVFSHGEERDPRLKDYPLSKVFKGDRAWFSYGELGIMTNRFDLESVSFNIKHQVALNGTFSWVDHYYKFKNNFEIEPSYTYFITDFFRVYGALEVEKAHPHPLVKQAHPLFHLKNIEMNGNARAGLKYLLPYFIELDLNVDNQLKLEVGLEYELLLFPWVEFLAEWEWSMDFGLINELAESKVWVNDFEWNLSLHYILSKNFSLTASYDNRFSYGAGLHWTF